MLREEQSKVLIDGVGKSERAGYNLAQAQRSRNTDAATQGGPQTGGGPKSYGYAKNKSNPVKSKSIGDTGATRTL